MSTSNYKHEIIYTKESILRPPLILVLFFNFVLNLAACPLWGQVLQKKELLSADYQNWSRLNLEKVSPNGQWTSYSLNYERNIDSVFVQNANAKKSFAFTSVESSKFPNDDLFLAKCGTELHTLNLKSGKKEVIEYVKQYDYSQSSGLLLVLSSDGNKNVLLILSTSGKILKEIEQVINFSLSPDGLHIVYASQTVDRYALRILDLRELKSEKWIILSKTEKMDNFCWDKLSKSVAFFSKNSAEDINKIFHYILKTDKLYEMNLKSRFDFPVDSLMARSEPALHISDDIQRVFFTVMNKPAISTGNSKSDVEIWNGNDKWVFSKEARDGFEKSLKNAVWLPQKKYFKLLSTDELPKIVLTGKEDYAVLSNPKLYEPQAEYYAPRDYYIMDLRTFTKKRILHKLPDAKRHVSPSPDGLYIAYFKDDSWWIYSIKEDKHTNITQNIPVKFTAKAELFTRESVCGNPGWSKKDNEILLYDQYDIWAVKPDGTYNRRLTHGRESKIRFRFAETPDKNRYFTIYEDNKIESYNLKETVYLRAEGDDGKTGYFKWTEKLKEQQIVYRDSYIDQFFFPIKAQNYIFREQKYDLSPQLVAIDNSSNCKLIYQSNPQQENYFWGRSELVRYTNSHGRDLKGVLIYPADYDTSKKYPMIVHIYELKSQELHRYKNPSLYNETGFNLTNFSLQGYFILLPDIVHEYRNVGGSTVECIKAAVEKVKEKNVVDPDKIGLIGFSFGGYETAFTVTQTNLFSAAVAGGAFTDLNSLYFTLGRGTGQPESWRFQSTYFMIEKSPYEAPDLYNASSPVFHVQKVTAPLLLWTGKNDPQVDPHQSMEFYLALRKFEKKNIMLQYPNETHVLLNPVNQIDITNRIQNWFDHYLKKVPSKWVLAGVKE